MVEGRKSLSDGNKAESTYASALEPGKTAELVQIVPSDIGIATCDSEIRAESG